MAGTIGYNTTPSLSITLTGGAVEQSRLQKTPSAEYVASSGDTATLVAIYVAGGSGADSTLNIGLYSGTSTTDPSAFPLAFSDSILITAAMKASPGWYTKAVSWSLVAGTTYRAAYAGVAAGSVDIGLDAPGGNVSSVNSGVNTLQNPFGVASYGSGSYVGMYVTVSAASAAARQLLTTGVG